jgi:hypothetical protein
MNTREFRPAMQMGHQAWSSDDISTARVLAAQNCGERMPLLLVLLMET